MCTVSAVTGALQNYKPVQDWTYQSWLGIQKILALCEKLDKQQGEPDCIDPEKDAWIKEMSDMYDKAKESN